MRLRMRVVAEPVADADDSPGACGVVFVLSLLFPLLIAMSMVSFASVLGLVSGEWLELPSPRTGDDVRIRLFGIRIPRNCH
jgi:hypothetical protein